MPGPGAHLMYALGSGVGLMHASSGRFSPQHCLFYSLNAFLGPDLGSFAEWLTSEALGYGFGAPLGVGSLAMSFLHHPFYYVLLLGLPLSFLLYSPLSAFLLRRGLLDTLSGVPLDRNQCFMLVAAGSLSHFFLDHLFEENGHSSMYVWILSTGWWETQAPINPAAVLVIGSLCVALLGGFVFINRVKPRKSVSRSRQSASLILVIIVLYCLWCASQIYWRNPRQPAIGEEADLGVLVFLLVYFFSPHCLCILSMNHGVREEACNLLPL